MSIDIGSELLRHGFDWTFPEMHLAIGTWHEDPSHKTSLRFRMQMTARGAVTGCLPVIRTAERTKAEGVPPLGDHHGFRWPSGPPRRGATRSYARQPGCAHDPRQRVLER